MWGLCGDEVRRMVDILVWRARRTRNMGMAWAMMVTAGSRKLKMDMKTMKSGDVGGCAWRKG